jgi:TetR/AcrR family transcriptional regulator
MQIWGMTQHHADYGVQVQGCSGWAQTNRWSANPSPAMLTTFVLLGCGLVPD